MSKANSPELKESVIDIAENMVIKIEQRSRIGKEEDPERGSTDHPMAVFCIL